METTITHPSQATGTYTALIFIPDISGFTKFLNETELAHSQGIISKLLEAILESNELGLSVSEIEGDAVLFYKIGSAPSLPEVAKQSKTMFLKFHHLLKVIDKTRTCNCAACDSVVRLTLKLICHYGTVSTITVRNFMKLLGSDVILAHRLLKNNIEGNEYVLLSENYLRSQAIQDLKSVIDWEEVKEGTIDYEHLGTVHYKYVSLSPLLRLVPPLE
ncbi:MAG: DUF2652 domain-containing protein [Ignavibacteriae bacterium]|nr:DUF2652 domain-containing protein [Ignavibacteriota bacterium]